MHEPGSGIITEIHTVKVACTAFKLHNLHWHLGEQCITEMSMHCNLDYVRTEPMWHMLQQEQHGKV